ncbi:hypothetical protein ACFL5O_03515 [Myxococcota bacterium]
MTPLRPDQITIWRRPLVIIVTFGFRLSMAAAVALPLSAVAVGAGIMDTPAGDAVLFEAGGGWLMEVLWSHPRMWGAAARVSLWLTLLGVPVGQIARAALMVALAHADRVVVPALVGRSLQHLVPFLIVTAAIRFAQAAVLLVGALLSLPLHRILRPLLDERQADLCVLGVGCVTVGLVFCLGILKDLGHAILVRWSNRVRDALPMAVTVARQSRMRLLRAYLPRWLFAVALIVGSAILVEYAQVDRPEVWRPVLPFVLHQGTMLGLTWLESSWLARVLAVVPWWPQLDAPAPPALPEGGPSTLPEGELAVHGAQAPASSGP